MSAYTDAQIIDCDPFDGADRDVKIRARTVRIVTARKPHVCAAPFGLNHGIRRGDRARVESAIVDGQPGRYYVCLPCMERVMRDEFDIQPENEENSKHG